jgi:hypothetical protein
MNNQVLRNLTTHRLHTNMGDIHEAIELLTGTPGVFTHQLPNAMTAMMPWLREKVGDPRFWDGAYDTTHEGETDIQPMTESERAEFFERFTELPSPFAENSS